MPPHDLTSFSVWLWHHTLTYNSKRPCYSPGHDYLHLVVGDAKMAVTLKTASKEIIIDVPLHDISNLIETFPESKRRHGCGDSVTVPCFGSSQHRHRVAIELGIIIALYELAQRDDLREEGYFPLKLPRDLTGPFKGFYLESIGVYLSYLRQITRFKIPIAAAIATAFVDGYIDLLPRSVLPYRCQAEMVFAVHRYYDRERHYDHWHRRLDHCINQAQHRIAHQVETLVKEVTTYSTDEVRRRLEGCLEEAKRSIEEKKKDSMFELLRQELALEITRVRELGGQMARLMCEIKGHDVVHTDI